MQQLAVIESPALWPPRIRIKTMGFSVTERKAALGLASVFATRMLGLFMIMPVFAIYGPQLDGFSPLWMGLAIGIYGLTQACLQIPMGYLSDRIGRKPVIYAGLVVFALGSVLAACSEHIVWVTVGRALQGAGAISSAVLALAADLSREHQRPKVMAIIGIFIGLSFTMALVIGPLVAASYGLAGLFWLTALLAVAAMLVVRFIVPNASHKAPMGDTLAKWSKVKELTHNSQLWRLSSGVLALHFCMTGLFVTLPPRLLTYHAGAHALWQLLLPVLLLSFVMLIPMMGGFNRRGNIKQGLLFSALLMVMSVLLLAFVQQFWWLMGAMALFFIGFNYLEASLPSLVAQFAPAGQKGSAMGVFASCQFSGAFLGGVCAGGVSQWLGTDAVWGLMALVLMTWFLFALSLQQTAKLKALQLAAPQADSGHWFKALLQLPGVVEAVHVPEERVVYLKVEPQIFESQRAEQLLAQAEPEH